MSDYDYNNYSSEHDSLENTDLTPNGPIDMTMKLPAKNHLNKLEDILASLNNDLIESKKNIQKLRGEFLYMGFQNSDNNAEMSNFIVNEAIKVTNTFKKLIQEDNEEFNGLKQQVATLIQDRMKLQQDTLVLENRVHETERELGYKTEL